MAHKLTYVIKGGWYIIECGWGKQKAKSEGHVLQDDGKIRYDWITAKGFRFHSFDLDKTEVF